MGSIYRQISPILINGQSINSIEITESARKHWRGSAAGIIEYVVSTLDGKTLKAIPGDFRNGYQVHTIYSNTLLGIAVPTKGKSPYRDHRIVLAGSCAVVFHGSPRTQKQYEKNIRFASFE